MQDIRAQLTRSKTVAQVSRKVTGFITIHYNGPSVKGFASDLALIKSDANFHVNTRGWDGLAYHYAIGRDGTQYQCRDFMARLNHSGVPQGNSESLAVFVAAGEGDVPPAVQLNSLQDLINTLKIAPRFILGHQEWPRATACPGAQLMRWINTYRLNNSGKIVTATTITTANRRDEPSVLSHLEATLPPNKLVSGRIKLGVPFRGDSLWLDLGDSTFIHGSTFRIEK